jgi:hypothetical protein
VRRAGDDGRVKTKQQTAECTNDGGFSQRCVQFELLSAGVSGKFDAKRIRTVLISNGSVCTVTVPS